MARRYNPTAPVGQYTPLHLVTSVNPVGVGRCISTTAPAPAGTGLQTVTPAAFGGIYSGQKLKVNQGSSNPYEIIVVASVNYTAGTFTAIFANAYTGTINLVSFADGTDLGPLVINQAGTGVTITLYNGSPLLYPLPTSPSPVCPDFGVIAVLVPGASDKRYACSLDYGLFYKTTQSSFGDYTLQYRDMSV